MFDFHYFTPTKVIFGKNTELQTAALIREFGGKKVLIHYGGGSVIRSGLLKIKSHTTVLPTLTVFLVIGCFASAVNLDIHAQWGCSIIEIVCLC